MRSLAIGLLAGLAVASASASALAVTISGTYYEDSQLNSCAGTQSCSVALPLAGATAGKFLYLEEVNCLVQMSGVAQFASYYLTDGGLNTNVRRLHYLDVTPVAGGVTFREDATFKVAGGPPRTLVISVAAIDIQTAINLTCTIAGTLAPQ